MDFELLMRQQGGLATTADLRTVMTPKALARHVDTGRVVRVWRGVYALDEPDILGRLAALDLFAGAPVVACMGTAAALYGFDTERTSKVHVLDPGARMRPAEGLMVHQRVGAPLRRVKGRLATAPAWTAVELARDLRRPRALASLDAALRVKACSVGDLATAVRAQKGRRGIVKVRELMEYADGRAESAMESEARLVFIDGGLPTPELQYRIRDRWGQEWRVDFAWPDAMLIAEYDSIEWHAGRAALVHDRLRTGRLHDCGWTVVSMTVEDIRYRPWDLVARLNGLFRRPGLAG